MAFGGNFLHNLNIGMQLRCYEMEGRLKTPDLFKFPYFEAICWYVANNLLETLKELREDNCQPPVYLTDGVKALINALRNWLKREVTEQASDVPDHIRPNHLIKELTKEIRYLEEEEEQSGGSKPVKSQGCGPCPLTRSTLDKAGHHARRTARLLRHHHHHHHAPKTPSNLEILELHTRQVLKRLEVGSFEQDVPFSSTVMAKFNKTSMASAAAVERSLDNNLLLVMCNGRIIRDERRHTSVKSSPVRDCKRTGDHQREGVLVKTELNDSKLEQHKDHEREEKPSPLSNFFERVNSDLRKGAVVYSDISDSESEERCSLQKKDSSGEDSGSSEEEREDKEHCRMARGSVKDLHQASQALHHFHKPLKGQRPTSPTTEEEAIEGMLSMAGLLYPQRPEESSTAQEPWWSSLAHQSPDSGKDPASGDDSDSNSTLILQDERRAQQHVRKECRAKLSQRIQENKNFMANQSSGSNSNSSEAWGDQSPSQAASSPLRLDPSSETDNQYSETSLSPPRHPSKRPAPNTPPISNQATKGKRPKKGMATAKQRLRKILKLSRNNHFLL